MSFKLQMRYMNPYDIHKTLINDYILKRPGDTKLLKRDSSRDRTDLDVIKEHHKFLWTDETPNTWEAQFAKKYYDKLFKEYCIGDLSHYKENKVALRWRTENEVLVGKGQFICGNKVCICKEDLRTWEVNFGYKEQGIKKNALVKIRLCPSCSEKLNYHSKKREIKLLKSKTLVGQKRKKPKKKNDQLEICNFDEANTSNSGTNDKDSLSGNKDESIHKNKDGDESPWTNLKPVESKSREEEMEDYLQELLL